MRWILAGLVLALGLGAWLHSPDEPRVAPCALGEILSPPSQHGANGAPLDLVDGSRTVENAPAVLVPAREAIAAPQLEATRGADVRPTLVPASAIPLRVVVNDFAGAPRAGARVTVASLKKPPAIDVLHGVSRADGSADFEAPSGNYEIVARDETLRAEARALRTLKHPRTVTLSLAEDELHVAVAGVLLDERDAGLADVTITASCTRTQEVLGDVESRQGRSLRTNEHGEFELRLRRTADCGHLDVVVAVDPFFADFAPAAVRVPFGTTNVVIRRMATWNPERVSVRGIHAASREAAVRATLVLQFANRAQRRTFEGRDGVIEAWIPRRYDVTWNLEVQGSVAASGTAAGLLDLASDGAVDVELARDPTRSASRRAR